LISNVKMQLGVIEKVDLKYSQGGTSKGYGFVNFVTSDMAKHALRYCPHVHIFIHKNKIKNPNENHLLNFLKNFMNDYCYNFKTLC